MIRMRMQAHDNASGGSGCFDELRTDVGIRAKCILTCDGIGNKTMLTKALPAMRARAARRRSLPPE
jgi:hypothetical protein